MKQRAIIILLTACLLVACASLSKKDQLKTLPASELYQGGETALSKNNYSNAISMFETLQSEYPLNPYLRQARLNLIYAYYAKGDYASCVAAADQYLRLYPRGPNADYVYYVRGLANFEMNRTVFAKLFPINPADRDLSSLERSFQDYRMLLTYYPDSPYAADARQRMVYLRDKLAEHEVDVAEYYFRRQAYVAAANRGSYVVQHFQHAPVVEKALAIMVKSYRAINEPNLAKEAYVVLKRNFPDSNAVRKLDA